MHRTTASGRHRSARHREDLLDELAQLLRDRELAAPIDDRRDTGGDRRFAVFVAERGASVSLTGSVAFPVIDRERVRMLAAAALQSG